MSLPFVIVEGVVLLADQLGNIPDVAVNPGSGIDQNRLKTETMVMGQDGLGHMDVIFKNGVWKASVDATVQIEQLFGKPLRAAVNFALGTFANCGSIGDIGDSYTINIAEGPCGATLQPALSIPVVVTATETGAVNPEIAMRDLIISTLNANANFKIQFKARKIKDNGIIFIESKEVGEVGERPTALDFGVAVTGNASVTLSDLNILRTGRETLLTPSNEDPRLGILDVAGNVTVSPGTLNDIFNMRFDDEGINADDMAINASGGIVNYWIRPDLIKDTFIEEIKFHFVANGIKFGSNKFLSLNSALTNGIGIEIRSDNVVSTLTMIKTTGDIKFDFAVGEGSKFELDIQPGGDDMAASFFPPATFPLRKAGTFGIDDYIKISLNDNLSSFDTAQALAFGFLKEV